MIEYYIYDELNIIKPTMKECTIFKVYYKYSTILEIKYSNEYTINNKQSIHDWEANNKIVRKLTLPLLLSLNIKWGKKAQIYINEFLENEARKFTQ